MKRPVGRPPIPVEMPSIPAQPRPDESLTWYVVKARAAFAIIGSGVPADEDETPSRIGTVERLWRQGYAAWCPLSIRERRHSRRVRYQLEPVFPPYLFVGVAPGQGVAPICTTIGISDLSRSRTGKPQTIRASLLGDLWDGIAAEGGAMKITPVGPGPWFEKDEAVSLRYGQWSAHRGRFSWSDGYRCKILFDMLGREVTVETTIDSVVRVK